MESCDVLIVGGGPAGSTCAGKLASAGLDVLLMDGKIFPRHKPCAGWITPAVLEALEIDSEEYRQGRVFQEVKSFRTGLIDGPELVTRYDFPVSYGIRRCEFDHYLLRRSASRQILGEPVSTLKRCDGGWLVNGYIRAKLLVGAGGHFCPVSRLLGSKINGEDVVVAQVAEFAMSPDQARLCRTPPDTPALYFCRDMKGYGWLFRKEEFLNVGLGRMDTVDLGRHTMDFCGFLAQRGDVAARFANQFRGHAYRVYGRRRACARVGDGALLVGDAAGLAHPQSGEGILPAVRSALLAADTILAADGKYGRANLESYATGLGNLFDNESVEIPSVPLLSGILRFLGARLLSNDRFARHVVLDRWFLHRSRQETGSRAPMKDLCVAPDA